LVYLNYNITTGKPLTAGAKKVRGES